MAEKIIIDTDPGVDDAMAILYAALHPDLELLALTAVFGNVTADIAARNAKVLSEMAGLDIPVAKGAATPLVQTPNPVSDYVHGAEGFGDVPPMQHEGALDPRSAAQLIVDMANNHPGEITLCPIGPFTNIALALDLDPDLPKKIKRVVMMGGGLDRGNVTPFAEANIWNDPHAADKVFAQDWQMVMVGLDLTADVVCPPADFADLADAVPRMGGFLNQAYQFYARFYRQAVGIDGCQMHDPAAIIAVHRPDLFEMEHVAVEVVCEGVEVGRTLRAPGSDRRPVACTVGGDGEAIKALFLSTIKTGD